MNRAMRNKALVIVLALLIGIPFHTNTAFANAAKVAKKNGVGTYLTDSKGMTLYVFKKDSPGKSTCLGECVVKWPIYYQEKVSAKGGLDAERFGAFTRSDDKKQSTYKGMPLYYYRDDKIAGDMNGQGIEDAWFIVAP